MKKTNYFKSIFRDIKNTKGKVLSIFIMIMLASMIIVGLFLTGATMRKTLAKTLNKSSHPDITISSTYGLNDEDKLIIEKDKDIEKLSYQKNIDLYDDKILISLNSIDKKFPKYIIREGRNPKKDDEIVLDKILEKNYKIGDIIDFSKSDNEKLNESLKNKKYKVVAFANSTENLMEDIRDYSLKGKKMVDGFAFISYDNFKKDDISKANISYKNTKSLDRFDEKYLSFVKEKKENIEYSFKNRPSEVIKKIKDKTNEKLDDKEKELSQSEKKLESEEKKLYDANTKILDGLDEYKKSKIEYENQISYGENQLKSSKQDIDIGFSKLENGKIQYEKGLLEFNNKFENANKTLKDSKNKIDKGFEEIEKSKEEIKNNRDLVNEKFLSQKIQLENLFDKVKNLENSKNNIEIQINEIYKKIENLEQEKNTLDKDHSKIIEIDLEIDKLKKEIEEKNLTKGELDKNYNQLKETYIDSENNYNKAYDEAISPIEEAWNKIEEKENELTDKKNNLDKAIKDFNIKKNESKIKLENSKKELDNNEYILNNALIEYNKGVKNLNDKKKLGKNKLDNAYQTLLENQREVEKANKEFEKKRKEAKKKIDDGYKEIEKARSELVKLPDPTYSIENILSNKAIDTYYKNSLNMDELSKVFPTFFYFIALLVSLTTIKRYIEEQRIQNGTLKSLGYSNKDIANKFYIYALTPTILGSLSGVFIGKYLIEKVIFNAYSSGFEIYDMDYSNSFMLMIATISLSIVLIGLTVFLTSRSEVKEQTADLLRAKPPKGGSRILLEKIYFIWSKLSFMTKITFRNLFRYKSRMLMTIFGIGGCTALLFFGFAMTDSIKDTSNIQRKEITKYDYINIFDTKSDEDDLKKYEKLIKNHKSMKIYFKEIKLNNGMKANLIVFDNDTNINDFINIRDTHKNKIKLKDNGLVATKKLADSLDSNDLIFDDLNNSIAKINDVAENYIDDYIYMNKNAYKNIFDKNVEFNADIIKDKDENLKDKLIKNDVSLSLIEPSKSYETMDNLMANLNLVIAIITLVSMILAIVVLYNLTNINVSERKKELATTKVLGFYPKETTAYIYRETYILTILGIFLGYILGYLMLRYVLSIVSPDGIYLSVKTHISSYLISAIITFFISFVIMIIVHKRLKKINMAEAMKASE